MPDGESRNAEVVAEDSRVATIRRGYSSAVSVLIRSQRRLVVKALGMVLMPVPCGINNLFEIRVNWAPTEISFYLVR